MYYIGIEKIHFSFSCERFIPFTSIANFATFLHLHIRIISFKKPTNLTYVCYQIKSFSIAYSTYVSFFWNKIYIGNTMRMKKVQVNEADNVYFIAAKPQETI